MVNSCFDLPSLQSGCHIDLPEDEQSLAFWLSLYVEIQSIEWHSNQETGAGERQFDIFFIRFYNLRMKTGDDWAREINPKKGSSRRILTASSDYEKTTQRNESVFDTTNVLLFQHAPRKQIFFYFYTRESRYSNLPSHDVEFSTKLVAKRPGAKPISVVWKKIGAFSQVVHFFREKNYDNLHISRPRFTKNLIVFALEEYSKIFLPTGYITLLRN